MTPGRRSTASTVAVIAAALGAGCAGLPSVAPGEDGPTGCAWDVCVHPAVSGEHLVFRARNDGPVAATVSLTFDVLENLAPTEPLPVSRVVPARSSAVVTRLRRLDRMASVNARPRVEIDLGDVATRPDPEAVYAPPFGGVEPRRLVAGWGSATHLAENFYAMDFAMPEGTPVLAARAGVVLVVQDGFTEGGLDEDLIDRANLVVVLHADATMASYGHLRPGLAVRPGDRVEEGQLLGSSGATGFSGIPHLHFHVGTRLIVGDGRTIAIRMRGPDGVPRRPLEGEWFAPAALRPTPAAAPRPARREASRGSGPERPSAGPPTRPPR